MVSGMPNTLRMTTPAKRAKGFQPATPPGDPESSGWISNEGVARDAPSLVSARGLRAVSKQISIPQNLALSVDHTLFATLTN